MPSKAELEPLAVPRRPPPSSGGGRLISIANANQAAVLEFVRSGSGHGIVEATAGSGKTTTLVMVAQLLVAEFLSQGSRACFLAFNRSTAAELRTRLPAAVEAQTLHSLGRQILNKAGSGAVELEPDKYRRLALALIRDTSDKSLAGAADVPELADHLNALFGYARLELTDLDDARALGSLCQRYHLSAPRPATELAALHALLPALFAAGSTGPGSAAPGAGVMSVDYTDMLYLPARLSLPPPRFAFLCVDEAQDLSPLALQLVLRLIEAGARALFVGDPFQAIYAFAGADARSLQRITKLTSATRLPLSVSFRCPIRHVSLARRFSPRMESAQGAPSGQVGLIEAANLPRTARPGDLIMARTNAPLSSLALALAKAGRPVRILGHDLAEPAKTLAGALFKGEALEAREPNGMADSVTLGRSSEGLLARSLEAERRRLESEFLTSERLPDELELSRLTHATLGLGLRALMAGRGPRNLATLAATLDRLFNPEHEHVLLSTIHRAKGREADRTFLLYPELLGVSAPLGPEIADPGAAADSVAEANVLFVALTRAKRELIFVEARPGAIAVRLAAVAADGATGRQETAAKSKFSEDTEPASRRTTSGPGRQWNDVLRLALIMSRANGGPGLSSRHGQAWRVQVRWREAGSGRRRTGRRRDRPRDDNR